MKKTLLKISLFLSFANLQSLLYAEPLISDDDPDKKKEESSSIFNTDSDKKKKDSYLFLMGESETNVKTPLPAPIPPKLNCSYVREGFEWAVRAAAFLPISDRVTDIYPDAWGDYQIELSQNFCQDWSIWFNAQYTYAHGRSKDCDDCIGGIRTKIELAPISLGARYNFYFGSCTDIYVGAGITCSFLRIHDHWPFVDQYIKKTNVGGLFKLGAKHYFTRFFFLEVFADYLLQRFHFSDNKCTACGFVERHDLILDGVTLGGGFGFHF
jgi:hypothetical protein